MINSFAPDCASRGFTVSPNLSSAACSPYFGAGNVRSMRSWQNRQQIFERQFNNASIMLPEGWV